MPRFQGIPAQTQAPLPRFGGEPANLNGLITQAGLTQQQRQQAGALSESPPIGNALSNRALAGIKRTQQGRLEFLESKYGVGNVVSEGEDFFIKQNGQFFRLDPKGFDVGDFADASGGIISGLPATVTGFATANPGVAAASGAAGEAVRGAISEFLPGDDNLSVGNTLARVGTNAALSGVAQVGANKLTAGIDRVLPRNVLARTTENALKSQAARNNLANSAEAGIPLDVAQLTESRQLEGLSGMARMHPASASVFQQFDEIVAEKSVQRLTGLLDDLSKTGSQIQAGAGVGKAYRGAVEQVLSRRSTQAGKDFGQVRLLTQGDKIIPANNTQSAIRGLIDEFDVPGGGDATSTLVKRLKRVSKEVGEEGFSATDMQRLLEIYGKASRGTGQVFKDIDKGQQRMVAARVFGALQRDLDEAAESGAGEAANALKKARDNYRLNSAPISELEENVLGRIFGGKFDPSPERIVEKFATMRPSEVKAAMDVLDGQTAQMVKREYLALGVDKALTANQGNPSFRTFNTWFQKNDKNLRAMLAPEEFRQVKLTYDVLRKVVQRGGVDGSQTAKWMMNFDMARKMFSLNPLSVASNAVQIIAPRTVAKAMTTPEGRGALFKVVTAKKPTQGAIKAAAFLGSLGAGAVDAVANPQPGQQNQIPGQ